MKDSFYFAPEDKKDRIALVYRHVDGKLVRAGENTLGGDSTLYRAGAIYPGPEFALYSTANDLLHFYQMLLNGGTYQGRRYLSKRSIETMRTIFTPDVQPSGAFGGTGYGLTFEIMRDAVGSVLLESPGCFGHGGAFGTEGWMDPHTDLIMISLVQLSDGTGSAVRAVVIPMAESSVLDVPE
jgi:CubicO group peptidase (beta-lactamase class C family)